MFSKLTIVGNMVLFSTLLLGSCGSETSSNRPVTSPSVEIDMQLDELASNPVVSPYYAIWILRNIVRNDGTRISVSDDDIVSLRYGLFENPGMVTGFTLCGGYIGQSQSAGLITNVLYDADSCSVEDELDSEIENIYKSSIEQVFDYSLDDNILKLEVSNGDKLYFEPGYDSRMEIAQSELFNEYTEKIRFEDVLFSSGDSVFLGLNTFELTRDMITENTAGFLNKLISTPIYVFQECPDIRDPDDEGFFEIMVTNTDGATYLHGAGKTCGTNLLGSRRFQRSDILELKNISGL